MKKLSLLLLSLVAAVTVLSVVPKVSAVDLLGQEPVCSGGDSNDCDKQSVCQQSNAVGMVPEFCHDDSTDNPDNNNPIWGPEGVVTKGVKIFLLITGIVAVFVILINAVRMITSNGDPKAFEGARNGLIYAAIGLAVAASASLIISLILSKV